MTEKVNWEIVHETERTSGPKGNVKPSLESLLGTWWRWKLAAFATVAVAVVALLVAFMGVVVVGLGAIALVSFAFAKLAAVVRRARTSSQSLNRRGSPPFSG